jgi:hypothetical protein
VVIEEAPPSLLLGVEIAADFSTCAADWNDVEICDYISLLPLQFCSILRDGWRSRGFAVVSTVIAKTVVEI